MFKQKVYLYLNKNEPGNCQYLAIDDKGQIPFILNDSECDILRVKSLLRQKGYNRQLDYEIFVLSDLRELPLHVFISYHKNQQKEKFEKTQLKIKTLLTELRFGNKSVVSVAADIGMIIEQEKQFALQQHLEITKLSIDQCVVEEKEEFNFEDGIKWAGLKLEEHLKELL